MALQLNGENCDDVCEGFMKSYYLNSFSKELGLAAHCSYTAAQESENPHYRKALKKISKWSIKPDQIPHKIIRAYLQLSQKLEFVTTQDLSAYCNDEDNHPDIYVPTFSSNFSQMKFDDEKSHGKVFLIDENNVITLWTHIKEEIMKNEKEFLKPHSTEIGYVNRNNQMNVGKTTVDGTDHMQKLYTMRCMNEGCGHVYFANGSDIFQKKCPKCQGGADTGFNEQ